MSVLNLITSGSRSGEDIRFLLAETAEGLQGVPSGKMITDSEGFSFVYLLDVEEGYRYLHFTQSVWPLMVDVLESDVEPTLSWKEQVISLPGFKEELTMLIYNIEGNNNYGEAFTSAVEHAFSAILNGAEV